MKPSFSNPILKSAMAILAVTAASLIPAHGATAQTATAEPLERHGSPCPTDSQSNPLSGWGYCDLYLTGVGQTDSIYILGTDEDGTTGQQVCAPTGGSSVRQCGPVTMYWSYVTAINDYTWEVWIHQGIAAVKGWQELSVGANSQTPLWTGCLDEDCTNVSLTERIDSYIGSPPPYNSVTQEYEPDPPPPETNLPSDATHGPYTSISQCLDGAPWGCFTHDDGQVYGWADPD
ncbi:MAG: hypothetical protein OXT07_09315 [bacterium]|nr:hypothetical protein [bacterium]MDE0216094.1 hypothetical protein [bacterium]